MRTLFICALCFFAPADTLLLRSRRHSALRSRNIPTMAAPTMNKNVGMYQSSKGNELEEQMGEGP